MASKYQQHQQRESSSTYNRRAYTEAQDEGGYDDPNQDEGAEHTGLPVDEDCDDVNLQNYKGIYANEDTGQKYQCPETGAHFEFNDLCRRMHKIMERRKLEDQKESKAS